MQPYGADGYQMIFDQIALGRSLLQQIKQLPTQRGPDLRPGLHYLVPERHIQQGPTFKRQKPFIF